MPRPTISWLGLALLGWSLGLGGCDLIRCQFGNSEGADAECTVEEEKARLYENLRDRYLYAPQVPELDLAAFDSAEAVLREVVTRVDPPDRFSFIQSRTSSDQAEQGRSPGGLGTRLAWIPGRGLLVTRVHGTFAPSAATAASEAGIARGDVIVAVEGAALGEMELGDAVNALGPDEAGVTRSLTLERPDGSRYEVTVVKQPFSLTTVPVARVLEDNVGYLLFETFIERSKEELAQAFDAFREADVRRVILDLRWNGGGRGDTSRFLLSLMLGKGYDGEVAYVQRFNEAYDSCLRTHRFDDQSESLDGLEEVVIITSPATASASELVWNVLRAYVPVRTVGAASVGKPYGFFPHDFCGKVLRAVNYRRENANGEAVPLDGIQPECAARDEVTGALGTTEDNLLRAAVDLIEGRGCAQALRTSPRPEPIGDGLRWY